MQTGIHRGLLAALALLVLLAQWGVIEHNYEDHDHGELCHLCLSAASHDETMASSPSAFPASIDTLFVVHATSYQLPAFRVRRHTIRAPPRFS